MRLWMMVKGTPAELAEAESIAKSLNLFETQRFRVAGGKLFIVGTGTKDAARHLTEMLKAALPSTEVEVEYPDETGKPVTAMDQPPAERNPLQSGVRTSAHTISFPTGLVAANLSVRTYPGEGDVPEAIKNAIAKAKEFEEKGYNTPLRFPTIAEVETWTGVSSEARGLGPSKGSTKTRYYGLKSADAKPEKMTDEASELYYKEMYAEKARIVNERRKERFGEKNPAGESLSPQPLNPAPWAIIHQRYGSPISKNPSAPGPERSWLETSPTDRNPDVSRPARNSKTVVTYQPSKVRDEQGNVIGHTSYPVITIYLQRDRKSEKVVALAMVDSGSGHCIIPRGTATDLGIVPEKLPGPRVRIGATGSNVFAKVGKVIITIVLDEEPPRVEKIDALFLLRSNKKDRWVLLGQHPFFEWYDISFQHGRNIWTFSTPAAKNPLGGVLRADSDDWDDDVPCVQCGKTDYDENAGECEECGQQVCADCWADGTCFVCHDPTDEGFDEEAGENPASMTYDQYAKMVRAKFPAISEEKIRGGWNLAVKQGKVVQKAPAAPAPTVVPPPPVPKVAEKPSTPAVAAPPPPPPDEPKPAPKPSARERGKMAFKAGETRMLPTEMVMRIGTPEGEEAGKEWFRGWDQANLAKPLPEQEPPPTQKPEPPKQAPPPVTATTPITTPQASVEVAPVPPATKGEERAPLQVFDTGVTGDSAKALELVRSGKFDRRQVMDMFRGLGASVGKQHTMGIQHLRRQINKQQFLTPLRVTEAWAKMCAVPANATVLDPNCGAGRAFWGVPNPKLVHGIDIATEALEISRAVYPEGNFLLDDIMNQTFNSEFDYVFINPPFSLPWTDELNFYQNASMGRKIQSDVAMVELAVRAVKPGGIIGMVLPVNTFTDKSGQIGRWLRKRATILACLVLPKDKKEFYFAIHGTPIALFVLWKNPKRQLGRRPPKDAIAEGKTGSYDWPLPDGKAMAEIGMGPPSDSGYDVGWFEICSTWEEFDKAVKHFIDGRIAYKSAAGDEVARRSMFEEIVKPYADSRKSTLPIRMQARVRDEEVKARKFGLGLRVESADVVTLKPATGWPDRINTWKRESPELVPNGQAAAAFIQMMRAGYREKKWNAVLRVHENEFDVNANRLDRLYYGDVAFDEMVPVSFLRRFGVNVERSQEFDDFFSRKLAWAKVQAAPFEQTAKPNPQANPDDPGAWVEFNADVGIRTAFADIYKQMAARYDALAEQPQTAFLKMLYPFQRDDSIRLSLKSSAMYAAQMGLGKTMVSISTIWVRDAKRVVIVVPPKLLENWRKEFQRTNMLSYIAAKVSEGKKTDVEAKGEWMALITGSGIEPDQYPIYDFKKDEVVPLPIPVITHHLVDPKTRDLSKLIKEVDKSIPLFGRGIALLPMTRSGLSKDMDEEIREELFETKGKDLMAFFRRWLAKSSNPNAKVTRVLVKVGQLKFYPDWTERWPWATFTTKVKAAVKKEFGYEPEMKKRKFTDAETAWVKEIMETEGLVKAGEAPVDVTKAVERGDIEPEAGAEKNPTDDEDDEVLTDESISKMDGEELFEAGLGLAPTPIEIHEASLEVEPNPPPTNARIVKKGHGQILIYAGDVEVGEASYKVFDDRLYLSFLRIESSWRAKGYGTAVLEYMKKKADRLNKPLTVIAKLPFEERSSGARQRERTPEWYREMAERGSRIQRYYVVHGFKAYESSMVYVPATKTDRNPPMFMFEDEDDDEDVEGPADEDVDYNTWENPGYYGYFADNVPVAMNPARGKKKQVPTEEEEEEKVEATTTYLGHVLGDLFDYVILDEAHIVSNAKSGLSRALMGLQPKAVNLLSGTPMRNKVMGLFTQFDFGWKSGSAAFPYTQESFVKTFGRIIYYDAFSKLKFTAEEQAHKFLGKETVKALRSDVDEDDVKLKAIALPEIDSVGVLRLMLDSMMLRRVKSEPGVKEYVQIPEPEIETVEIKADPTHFAFYKEWADVAADILAQYLGIKREVLGFETDEEEEEEGEGGDVGVSAIVMALLSKLALVSAAPQSPSVGELSPEAINEMFPEEYMDKRKKKMQKGMQRLDAALKAEGFKYPIYGGGLTAKQVWILDFLKQAKKDKENTLVLMHNLDTLKIFAKALKDAGITYIEIFGDVSFSRRYKLLEEVKGAERGAAILATIGTMDTGLNIPEARNVIIVDPDWNYANQEQAWSRVLRSKDSPGERPKGGYRVRVCVNRGFIDDYVWKLAKIKRDWTSDAIDRSEPLEYEQWSDWLSLIKELTTSIYGEAIEIKLKPEKGEKGGKEMSSEEAMGDGDF